MISCNNKEKIITSVYYYRNCDFIKFPFSFNLYFEISLILIHHLFKTPLVMEYSLSAYIVCLLPELFALNKLPNIQEFIKKMQIFF